MEFVAMPDSIYHFGFYLLIAQWILRDAEHLISGLECAVVSGLRSAARVRDEWNRLFRSRNAGDLENLPQNNRQNIT
jgi:hypothetical protein